MTKLLLLIRVCLFASGTLWAAVAIAVPSVQWARTFPSVVRSDTLTHSDVGHLQVGQIAQACSSGHAHAPSEAVRDVRPRES